MTPRQQIQRIATEVDHEHPWLAERLRAIASWPEPAALPAVLEQAREALRWLVNIGHGQSKGGDETSPPRIEEVQAAIRDGETALAAIGNYRPEPSLAAANLIAHLEAAAEDARRGASGSVSIPAATLDDWAARLRAIGESAPPPAPVDREQLARAIRAGYAPTLSASMWDELHEDSRDRWRRAADAVLRVVGPAENDSLARLFSELRAWAVVTFPNQTPESIAKHLLREAFELAERPRDPREMADVFLLVGDLMLATGNDPLAVARAKFDECKAREWGPPDAEGVVEHVREPPPAEGPCARALRELVAALLPFRLDLSGTGTGGYLPDDAEVVVDAVFAKCVASVGEARRLISAWNAAQSALAGQRAEAP